MALGGFECSKITLTLLNVLYIMVAFILIGVAAYGKAVAIIDTVSVMGGVIVCGSLLIVLAVVGLIGTVRHHQVMLFFYMIILFVLFLVQFALACACLALNSAQQHEILRLGWARASNELKQNMQTQFDCCGFDNDTANIMQGDAEYMGHPPCGGLKCCDGVSLSGNGTSCNCLTCFTRAKPHLNEAAKTVGGLGLFFSVTELIGVWLTIRYRNQKDPRANPNAFL